MFLLICAKTRNYTAHQTLFHSCQLKQCPRNDVVKQNKAAMFFLKTDIEVTELCCHLGPITKGRIPMFSSVSVIAQRCKSTRRRGYSETDMSKRFAEFGQAIKSCSFCTSVVSLRSTKSLSFFHCFELRLWLLTWKSCIIQSVVNNAIGPCQEHQQNLCNPCFCMKIHLLPN